MSGKSFVPLDLRESFHFERTFVYGKNPSIKSGMGWRDVHRIIRESFSFLESLGTKLHFPLRTVILAQRYFLQYSLFNSLATYPYEDVCIACIFLSCKTQETCSKKINKILLAAVQMKNPPLGDKEIDPAILEGQRKMVIGYERVVLESIGFRFEHELPFELFVKMAKYHGIGGQEETFREGWWMLKGMFREYLPLIYHNAILCVFCLHRAERRPVMKNRLYHFAISYLEIPIPLWTQLNDDFMRSCNEHRQ